ncbi:MAG TPA: hypothetical protein VGF01_04560, partial [Terracidiphilus sp.]
MQISSPSFEHPVSGPDNRSDSVPGSVPLFRAAWLFAAGIAASQAFAFFQRPSLMLLALLPLAVLCGLSAFQAQRIAWLPLALVWLMLGAWCARMEPRPVPAPALSALSDGLLRSVEGTVVDAGPVRNEIEENLDDPQAAQRPMQRVDLRTSSLEVVTDTKDAQEPVAGGVRLTIQWPQNLAGQQSFHCGER